MKLEAHDLTYRYPDGTVVGPLTMTATAGVVHLAGPNGVGKSTLMRVLGGVLPAGDGQVRLDGRDPFADHAVRAHVGAASPEPELPGFLTAEEVVLQWAAFRGRASWDPAPLLDALALPPRLRLDQMSSGQRRRAELAGALAAEPFLLLLDEVFTHLDDAGVAWLVGELQARRDQRIVVLCHHGVLPLEADQTVELPPARRA